MVSYFEVKTSNVETLASLPDHLVALFVGATNGIGEYTLKEFAKHARSPRVYFIGRSHEAGTRIAAECKTLNDGGSFTFIQADTSLVRNVDNLCDDIRSKESAINILFISTGTLDFNTKTSEGLPLAASLVHFSRARFIHNLLPELRAATSLSRVVSVFAGTKEGMLYIEDINGENMPLLKARGHAASLVTAGMMTLAQQAPDVSFIHTFPGPVKSGIGRDMPGIFGVLVRMVSAVVGPIFNIPTDESGAYHLFFTTSPRYPPKDAAGERHQSSTLGFARGIDGNAGSGMYCVDQTGKSANPGTEALLANLKKDGSVDKVWQLTQDKWKQILGGSEN